MWLYEKQLNDVKETIEGLRTALMAADSYLSLLGVDADTDMTRRDICRLLNEEPSRDPDGNIYVHDPVKAEAAKRALSTPNDKGQARRE